MILDSCLLLWATLYVLRQTEVLVKKIRFVQTSRHRPIVKKYFLCQRLNAFFSAFTDDRDDA